MMNWKKWAMGLGMSVALVGCSSMPSTPEEDGFQNVRAEVDRSFPNYLVGIGYGATLVEADERARTNLSQQILTVVSKSFNQTTEVENQDKVQSSKMRAQSTARLFSAVDIEDAKVLQENEIRPGKYYVAVGVKEEKAAYLRQLAKKKLPLLTLVDSIEKTDDLSRKMRLAQQGLRRAEELKLADSYVLTSQGRFTFESYFHDAEQSVVEQLQFVFEEIGRTQISGRIVQRDTLKPVANFDFDVNGQALSTDTYGRFSFATSKRTREWLFRSRGLKLAVLNRNMPPQSQVYVVSMPVGALASVYVDGDLVQTGSTPVVVGLDSSGADKVKVVLKTTDKREKTYQFNLQKGESKYVQKVFSLKEYGRLHLDASWGNQFNVMNPDGSWLAQGDSELNLSKAEVGTYEVTLYNSNGLDDEDYQVVRDEVTVFQDQTSRRDYQAVANRGYYSTRNAFYWGFDLNVALQKDFKLSKDNLEFSVDELENLNGKSMKSIGMQFGYRKYFTHLYVGGNLTMLLGNSSKESRDDKISFSGNLFNVEVGSDYRLDDASLYFGGGYTVGELSTDSIRYASNRSSTASFSADVKAPYAEIGYDMEGFRVGARHYLNDLETTFMLGFSFGSYKSGYEKSRYKEAQNLIDY